MVNREELHAIADKVDSLIEFLILHNQKDFLPGLRTISRLGRLDGTDPELLLKEMTDDYWRMHGGYGSFSDIVLKGKDLDERRALNSTLAAYTDSLARALPSQRGISGQAHA